MKNETSDYYTWDDVVFENRNKNYGAYLVRRSYSRNSMIAFGASVSFAILLLFSPQIITYLSGGKLVVPVIIDPKLPTITIINPPPVIPDIIQPPPAATISKPATNFPPQVVITETDAVIPPNSELLTPDAPVGDNNSVYVETPGSGVVETPVVAPPSGPLDFAEVMPAYNGGLQAMTKFLSKNLRYPKAASSMGIEGTVYVSFVIDAEGNVVNVKVIRGVSADCDKEAIRVIEKMNEWNPGQMNHNPVAVRMMLPIKFQLNH